MHIKEIGGWFVSEDSTGVSEKVLYLTWMSKQETVQMHVFLGWRVACASVCNVESDCCYQVGWGRLVYVSIRDLNLMQAVIGHQRRQHRQKEELAYNNSLDCPLQFLCLFISTVA